MYVYAGNDNYFCKQAKHYKVKVKSIAKESTTIINDTFVWNDAKY